MLHKTRTYLKSIKKVLKTKITQEQIDFSLDILQKDINDTRIRYHKINCKKDKNRISITVPNTQYRILITHLDNDFFLRCICNHDDYDKYNNNC